MRGMTIRVKPYTPAAGQDARPASGASRALLAATGLPRAATFPVSQDARREI
jgi:hypothetical protein